MPLSSGLSIHDDTKHKGSAKRDAANGVAGLDASVEIPIALLKTDVANGIARLDSGGSILAPHHSLYLTGGAGGDMYIRDRTSMEPAAHIRRVAANDFKLEMWESNVLKEVLTESIIDVANGIAGLDANARIVSDLLGVGSQRGEHTLKSASATLRNSHDAEVQMGESVWTLQKTITVDNGISGILRIKHDNYNHVATDHTLSQVRKNGVILGVVHDNSAATTYTTYSEDLDVGVMQAAETLELWGYGLPVGAANHKVKNFRLYYDDNLPIAVDTTNSTP